MPSGSRVFSHSCSYFLMPGRMSSSGEVNVSRISLQLDDREEESEVESSSPFRT